MVLTVSGASNSCSATVTVVDQTAPIITLNGTNPLPVECANGFTDPGATALDNCSGTRTVTATNNINLNVPGSYTITYAASDGNVFWSLGMADKIPTNVFDRYRKSEAFMASKKLLPDGSDAHSRVLDPLFTLTGKLKS